MSRNFRHSQVYVHAATPIHEPADLVGKRVGVFESEMTAALWIRGFLEHDYGVQAKQLRWFTGGLAEPAWAERRREPLPGAPEVERIPPERTLEEMLAVGDLDTLITIQAPAASHRQVARCAGSSPISERSSATTSRGRTSFRSCISVVVRRDVYDQHRWVAPALVDAFQQAKLRGVRRMRATTGLAVSLPWLAGDLEEVDELFGGDAFPYGVEPNRHVLEAMCAYSFEQGLSARPVDVSELFAPETYEQALPL